MAAIATSVANKASPVARALPPCPARRSRRPSPPGGEPGHLTGASAWAAAAP